MKLEVEVCEAISRREAGEDKLVISGHIIKDNGNEAFFYLEIGRITCKLCLEKGNIDLLESFEKILGKPLHMGEEAGFHMAIWRSSSDLIRRLEGLLGFEIII
ncbi:MAG: hypothetical protein DRJ66_03665 [Thermoprotei archaeon]|nr:MAG: hypothetical protein DRJ66_03665 [Thermoprotei archaeon]RLF19887.1 MAG: hypothetical protein DRZ82_04220 [Thermoprotei archaeon]